jgi:hypothetical protein
MRQNRFSPIIYQRRNAGEGAVGLSNPRNPRLGKFLSVSAVSPIRTWKSNLKATRTFYFFFE